MKGFFGVVAAIIVLIALVSNGHDNNNSTSDSAAVADSGGEPASNIYLIASQSFCAATGIDDAFSGDGHVVFFLAFRNSGNEAGTVDATPVRHYDDGEQNGSAMDMVSVDVPALETTKVHTTAMTYKAHSHEIVDCGVDVNGEEVPVAMR